ncbi:MAG: hypothetical protein R3B96_23245 [Pirellulaceae bacterium]
MAGWHHSDDCVEELPAEARKIWLHGSGKTHITFTWRGGKQAVKYGGTFDGLIPELETKYRGMKKGAHREKLERYMRHGSLS